MFPLGTVLVPSMMLPLRVFEERYRAMLEHCLAGNRSFGVTLIERGSDVGGGDIRSSVGCRALIIACGPFDGDVALLVTGTARIRVDRWLQDDPYPIAEVSEWPDPVPNGELTRLVDRVADDVRRVTALAVECGEWSGPVGPELSDDPVLAGYQLIAHSPLGPFDRQRLLSASSLEERIALLETLVADRESALLNGLNLDGWGAPGGPEGPADPHGTTPHRPR